MRLRSESTALDENDVVRRVRAMLRTPKDGINGKDGVNGRDGRHGVDGKDGRDGINGISGTDGKDGKDGARGLQGLIGKAGSDGRNGSDGWSPLLSVEEDGARRVVRVSDWTGGEGQKPASGFYLGPNGAVSSKELATDIRGQQGAAGSSSVSRAVQSVFIGNLPNIGYPAIGFMPVGGAYSMWVNV